MAVPTVTPLPTPPNRTSGAGEFAPRADIFFGAMPQFQTDMNTLATYSGQQVSLADTARIAAEAAKAAAESARTTTVTRANEVATNTNTVVTRANEVATNTLQVAANTQQVADDAQAVAAALASIADGPVVSIAGQAGVVTLEQLRAGGVATQTGAETLSNKTLDGAVHTGVIDQTGSVRANVVALAANTLDCSLGNYFTRTISANSTFAFSNVPTSRAYSCTLELTHTSGTVTWPTSVQWPGGTAPTLTTGKTHIFIFVTDDGGARWRGAALTNYTN